MFEDEDVEYERILIPTGNPGGGGGQNRGGAAQGC